MYKRREWNWDVSLCCQKVEICMVQACHTPWQPLQNHPSGHLGEVGDAVIRRGNAGWTTSKSGPPSPCQNCPQGPLQKSLEEDVCWIVSHVPLMTQLVKGLNWTMLPVNWTMLPVNNITERSWSPIKTQSFTYQYCYILLCFFEFQA